MHNAINSGIVIRYVLVSYCWFYESHGGHVGYQEQKCFSPLGTKHHFQENYSKNVYCIDHQRGRLVA